MTPLIRLGLAVFLAFALSACTGLPVGGQRATVHDLRVLARSISPRLPPNIGITVAEARRLVDVEARLEAVAGLHVDDFYLVDAAETNAFAALRDGRRVLFINRPFVHALAGDESALASLLGHEIAHLALDHPATNAPAPTSSASGAFVSTGGPAPSLSHSRTHEQEADALGLDYAVRAGFDAAGALRVFAAVPAGVSGGGGLFDSHPANAERVVRLRRLIEVKYAGQKSA